MADSNAVMPAESARSATDADRETLEELRGRARASISGVRGGGMLSGHDRTDEEGRRLIDAALAGSASERVFLGLLDEVAVGYLLAQIEPAADRASVGVVTELFVEPWARELGVGEAMMARLVSWATQTGCRGIDAVALPGDRGTKNFFESHGLVARAIVVYRELPDRD